MQQSYPLTTLACGQSAVIQAVRSKGAMYERLCDLGFTPNSLVTCLYASVFGDPRAYRVRGTVIALRGQDAEQVDCVLCGGAV